LCCVCDGKILEVRKTCKSPTTRWNNATLGQRQNALGASADPPPTPPVRNALAPTMQCNVASVCGGHLRQVQRLPPSPTSALQRGTRASQGLAITLHTIYTVHTSVLEWPTVAPPRHDHGCDPCHARHPQTLVCMRTQHFHIGNQVCVTGWRTEGGVGECDASSQHTHRDAKCGLPWRLRHGLAVARDETHPAYSAPPLARAARLSKKASHSPNYHPIKRLPLGQRLNFCHRPSSKFLWWFVWVALPSCPSTCVEFCLCSRLLRSRIPLPPCGIDRYRLWLHIHVWGAG
jgi:hypothetical protein